MRPLARTVLALLIALSTVTAALAAGPGYRLEVAGLACPFCAYGIEKKLSGLDGVNSVETNIAEGVVVVTMEEGATLEEAAARQAVRDAGFTLDGFARISPGADP